MIINEHQFVEELLDTKKMPRNMSVRKLISYIARYYYFDCKDMEIRDYRNFIFDKVMEFNLDTSIFRESAYAVFTEGFCRKIKSGKISYELPNPVEVTLTEKEFEKVQNAGDEKHQKVLFTMYVLAKTRPKNDGWINYSLKEIFQYANVNVKRDDRLYMLYDLKKDGLISLPSSYAKMAVKVEIQAETKKNPIVFTVSNFQNIGNQYLCSIKKDWKMCESCGHMIKIKSEEGRPIKYCSKCAAAIKKEQDKQLYEKRKNSEKTN